MSIRILNCKTEYMVNPLGLDTAAPRLFWQLESERPETVQTAYRILVAHSRDELDREEGTAWDSGITSSGDSAHIAYGGKPLEAEALYIWKVKVWDGEGLESEWSEPALWTMGLLDRGAWRGKWIGRKAEPSVQLQPPPYLRKSFKLRGGIRRAVAYATALGIYELQVNGHRVGDRFAPGWTDYDKRVQYQTYDITDLLKAGGNAVGVILGDGWYSGTVGFLGKSVYGQRPFFLLQLNIDYEDGSRESITTDGTWRTMRGPIAYSDMIQGEEYDARLELGDWSTAEYGDEAWEKPDVRAGYNGLIVAMVEPPVRITQTVKPISVRKTAAGSYIFDMGQNMVGWTEVRASGAWGTRITLSHAEMLSPDGSLYLDNLRKAVQQDHYVMNGEGEEQYEPHFTFHGFRYVEVIGFPGVPGLDDVTGKVIHSDTPAAGKLETSDEMVNKLYSNITWGQRGNFLSVPTDCPQRDERLGWTGDAQIFARTASYNMDVSRFFTKYVWDMIDCQQPSGAFTDVAPDGGWIRHKMWNTRLNWFAPDNSGWGDAGVIIPWTLYLMYGDIRVLERHYDAMERWVQYLKQNSDGLIRPDYANYADWLSIGADTPNEVLATAYFAYSAKLLSRIAGVLGKREDEQTYDELHAAVADAFRGAFVDGSGQIHGDTQTVYVLALQFGLLTEQLRKKAIDRLVADIRGRGNRLSTGFLGVGYLLPALTDNGHTEVAYDLLTQEEFPSWMYSIKHGATTIWERWDGWTEEKGFQTPSMNSFNHYSLGSVGEWMYRYMAGIEADPASPGFKHAIIRPRPGGRLTWVKASYASNYGTISTEWQMEPNGVFKLQVSIPANTTADVYVPGEAALVNGAEPGISPVPGSKQDGCSLFRLGSGRYAFESIQAGIPHC
ncbi:glycoside hydrolase family 78 protein [Paenibacillus sp. LHD-38]|uniref:glycoside hydrolase family 78 protein n=1 Tax=Paenibacillus sp. LHD-38 TaxID=3072143 RepID=UPI00280C73B5|nr:glycoside hydrolase family 78 protein [Paenibacillus sp. LHD-38]MDQ8733092.1 glycoside hydrolase family 78 protein [Paenibacillus sp. LHD-38]